MEPRLSHRPAALDCCRRVTARFRWLVNGHAAEEATLDNPTLPRIMLLQPVQRVIKRDQRLGLGVGGVRSRADGGLDLVERGQSLAAAAFCATLSLRVIDQDVSHGARRDAEKVRSI